MARLDLPGVTAERLDDLNYRLKFAREESSAANVIRAVVNTVEVRDIVIEEQSIEDVVKRIYTGKVFVESTP